MVTVQVFRWKAASAFFNSPPCDEIHSYVYGGLEAAPDGDKRQGVT
jgi:hypothetical protein